MPKASLTTTIAVRNAVQNDVLELQFLDLLYDDIRKNEDGYGWEFVNVVEDVVGKVKRLAPKNILLEIDSEGGDAGIALALYNFLTGYSTENGAIIEVRVIGMAGSAASVLACAASPGKLRVARNAFIVIHRAWGNGYGNSEDLRAAADIIDKYTAQIVDIYTKRTGQTAEQIDALMANGDYWMTGAEAVEQGFADEVYNDNPQFVIAARVKDLHPAYKNAPQATDTTPNASTAKGGNPPEGATTHTGQPATTTPSNSTTMSFKDRALAFVQNLGKKPIDRNASNLAEEVANHIGEPLEAMMAGIEEESETRVNAAVAKITTDVTNAVSTAFEERLKTLETANAALIKKNEDLERDIAEKVGGQASAGANANTEKPTIGRFVGKKSED